MNITVFSEREQKTAQIEFAGKTIKELLHHLNINPETVLVARNKEVLTEEEVLEENDLIELLSVISGG